MAGFLDILWEVPWHQIVSFKVKNVSFLLQKLREYLEGSNLITKLQAKHDLLQRTLGEGQLSERVGEMTWIISCVVYVFHEEYEP